MERKRGRPPGAPNKATKERQARIAAEGITPLDYMIAVMRDENEPADRRDDMAKAAAPYVHPRLTSVESKNETVHRYVARLPEKAASPDAWQQQYTPEQLKTFQ